MTRYLLKGWRALLFTLFCVCAGSLAAQNFSLQVQPDGPTFPSAVITGSTVRPAADWPTYTATVNTATTTHNLFRWQNDGPQWNATLAQQIANWLANSALGVEADLGGGRPFLDSDTLNLDITNAPVSILNTRFQTLVGSHSLSADASMTYNVVDPSTQTGTWYPVQLTGGGDLAQVFLTGAEALEAQTSQITPFTCWTDSPGVDHHLLVIYRNTGFIQEFYQFKICNGIATAYSAKLWNSLAAYDMQNFFGGDSVDAAGLSVTAHNAKYKDIQRIIAAGPAAIAAGLPYPLRMTVPATSTILNSNGPEGCDEKPATHNAGQRGTPTSDPPYACMGSRVRLNANYDVSGLSLINQVLANTLKHHGAVVADNSSGYYLFNIAADPNWDFNDLAALGQISFTNYQVVSVNNSAIYATYTNDDQYGSDGVVLGGYSPNCNSYAASSAGNCSPTYSTLANPYNRPTITTETATAGASTSSSALSVALGTPVTLTLTDTNSTVHFFDCAGPFTGSTITITPLASITCTAYSRGSYGFRKGSTISITVTGTQAAAPAFSPAPGSDGNYGGGQTVTMTTSTPGATIRYTLDGQTPVCYGSTTPVYTGPVPITLTTSVNAITCKPGLLQSAQTSGTYTIANSPAVLGAVNYSYYNGGNATTSLTVTANNPSAGTLNIISGTFRDLTQTPAIATVTSSDGRTCSYITSKFYLATDNSGYWGNAAWSCPNAPAGTITYTATWPSPQGSYNPILHSYVWTSAATANAVEGATGGSGPTNGTLSCGAVATTGTNEIIQMVGEVPYADIDINAWTKISIPGAQSWYSPNVPSPASTTVTPTVTGGAFYSCIAFAIEHR